MTWRAVTVAGPVDASGTPGGSARSLTGGVGPGSFATVGVGGEAFCDPPHPAAAVTESAAITATTERPAAMAG